MPTSAERALSLLIEHGLSEAQQIAWKNLYALADNAHDWHHWSDVAFLLSYHPDARNVQLKIALSI